MNITVTTSDQAQVNFVNNGQSQQSPADIENNNARSSVSKRPASLSGEDNGRAKRPRDASSNTSPASDSSDRLDCGWISYS
jgi:hypothetical protein